MSDKVREAGEYVAALKWAACCSGDEQADTYLSDMIDTVVGIVRAAALEEAMHAVKHGPLCKGCKRVGRNAIRALAGRGA